MSNQKLRIMNERLGKITRIFSHFDEDVDGYWSLDEANAAAVATNGQPASAEDWAQLCQLLEADPSKGLSFDDVARTYLDKDVYTLLGTSQTQVDKDYDAVMEPIYASVVQKFKKVLTKDSEMEFRRKMQPFTFSAGEIIIKRGGLSQGLYVITKGSCSIDSGGSSPKVVMKSGSVMGSSCIRADPAMANEGGGEKKKLSKAQKRNRKGKSEKIARWLSLKQCDGLFNVASTYEAKCVTDVKGYLIPSLTVLRTVAIEDLFRTFLAEMMEDDLATRRNTEESEDDTKEKGGDHSAGVLEEEREGGEEGKGIIREESTEKSGEEGEVEGEGDLSFDFDPENVSFSWETGDARKAEQTGGGGGEGQGGSSNELTTRRKHRRQEEDQLPDTKSHKNEKNEEEDDIKIGNSSELKESSPLALLSRSSSSSSTTRDKAKEDMMLLTVHSFFDKDGDGYWNAKEACAAQLITEGTPMMEDEYVLICEMLRADSSKGLAVKDVWRLYLDSEFKATMGMSDEMIAEDTLGKDYGVVLNAKKKINKKKKKKKKKSGTK